MTQLWNILLIAGALLSMAAPVNAQTTPPFTTAGSTIDMMNFQYDQQGDLPDTVDPITDDVTDIYNIDDINNEIRYGYDATNNGDRGSDDETDDETDDGTGMSMSKRSLSKRDTTTCGADYQKVSDFPIPPGWQPYDEYPYNIAPSNYFYKMNVFTVCSSNEAGTSKEVKSVAIMRLKGKNEK